MAFNFSQLGGWFVTTEADVVALIARVKADVVVVENDVHSALNWIAGEVPTIVEGLQVALGLAQAVGFVTAPELAAANAAVVALNAFAAAHNSGVSGLSTDAKSVVAGYVAYQQASAAVSAAKAVAAQGLPPKAPAAPAPAPVPSSGSSFELSTAN